MFLYLPMGPTKQLQKEFAFLLKSLYLFVKAPNNHTLSMHPTTLLSPVKASRPAKSIATIKEFDAARALKWHEVTLGYISLLLDCAVLIGPSDEEKLERFRKSGFNPNEAAILLLSYYEK